MEKQTVYKAWQLMPGLFDYNKADIKLALIKSRPYRVESTRSFAYQSSTLKFTLDEVHQVATAKQGKSCQLTFIFRDSKSDLAFHLDKPDYLHLKMNLIEYLSQSPLQRSHLFMIKTHIIQKRTRLLTLPRQIVTSAQLPQSSQLDNVQHGTDDRIGYRVSIRTQTKDVIYCDLQVWFQQPNVFVSWSGSKQHRLANYEQNRNYENYLVDFYLDGGIQWQVQFQNLYKLYQFAQQIASYHSVLLPLESTSRKQCQLKLSCYAVTWNMAREHQDIDFTQLIPNFAQYDVIIWGAQECAMKEKDIQMAKVKTYLYGFHRVAQVEMWEMLLVVYVKNDHVAYLKQIETSQKACGAMGLMGNKGGLLVSFNLYNKQFNAVCVHLKAGAFKGKQRTEMMAKVLKGMSQTGVEIDATADFTFIVGDMNYRFKSSYQNHIKQVLRSHKLVRDLDEYCDEKKSGKYPHYSEMRIEFAPTYKLNSFCNAIYINKNDQCPSYTDRILFKSNDVHSTFTGREYNCIKDLFGSDHRPVFLNCELGLNYEHYTDQHRLLNKDTPNQGRGELTIRSFGIKLFVQAHCQLQFSADWLTESPMSYLKLLNQDMRQHWKRHQLPLLYTPINSKEVLEQKRLLIQVHLAQGGGGLEQWGYCIVHFDRLEETGSRLVKCCNGKVISANGYEGTFECVLEYKIVGLEQAIEDANPTLLAVLDVKDPHRTLSSSGAKTKNLLPLASLVKRTTTPESKKPLVRRMTHDFKAEDIEESKERGTIRVHPKI